MCGQAGSSTDTKRTKQKLKQSNTDILQSINVLPCTSLHWIHWSVRNTVYFIDFTAMYDYIALHWIDFIEQKKMLWLHTTALNTLYCTEYTAVHWKHCTALNTLRYTEYTALQWKHCTALNTLQYPEYTALLWIYCTELMTLRCTEYIRFLSGIYSAI